MACEINNTTLNVWHDNITTHLKWELDNWRTVPAFFFKYTTCESARKMLNYKIVIGNGILYIYKYIILSTYDKTTKTLIWSTNWTYILLTNTS